MPRFHLCENIENNTPFNGKVLIALYGIFVSKQHTCVKNNDAMLRFWITKAFTQKGFNLCLKSSVAERYGTIEDVDNGIAA